jgi:heme oxygenase
LTKPPPIIERVRDATRAAHSQLEERLDIFARLAVPANRARLVARFYGFHAGAERAVSPVLAALPGLDYPDRRRTPLLLDDLAAMGVGEPHDLALWTPLRASSVAEALGLLYVLEGSTLGGKIIRRQVVAGGGTMIGLSFLDPYRERSGERWHAFLAVVAREISAEDRTAAADFVGAAVRGFENAKRWLCDDAAPDHCGRTRPEGVRPGADPHSGVDSAAWAASGSRR